MCITTFNLRVGITHALKALLPLLSGYAVDHWCVKICYNFYNFCNCLHWRAVQQLSSALRATTTIVVYSTTFLVSDRLW